MYICAYLGWYLGHLEGCLGGSGSTDTNWSADMAVSINWGGCSFWGVLRIRALPLIFGNSHIVEPNTTSGNTWMLGGTYEVGQSAGGRRA